MRGTGCESASDVDAILGQQGRGNSGAEVFGFKCPGNGNTDLVPGRCDCREARTGENQGPQHHAFGGQGDRSGERWGSAPADEREVNQVQRTDPGHEPNDKQIFPE